MRDALKKLLHLKDTPHRTALAFALGVFIAFSPLLGLHTPLAIVLAFAFGLNRVAVLAGAWINFWALPPCYAFGTLLGALVLGVNTGNFDAADWEGRGISALWSNLRKLFWPIVVGNTLLGAIAAILAYGLARKFIEARAARSAENA